MGLFDYVRCMRPLPGDPPKTVLEWQTKDTPAQAMDTYEIREDGSLWGEEYDIEDRSDPNAEGLLALCGCMTRVNIRPVKCALTGEVRFYGCEGHNIDKWWEYSAYFIDGELQSLTLLESPAAPHEGGGVMECRHFWVQIGTDGNIQCAWCGKVAPPPIQWTSDTTTTTPLTAHKAQEESK